VRVESSTPGSVTWFTGFLDDLEVFFPGAKVYSVRR
jgi:hypothetical protein